MTKMTEKYRQGGDGYEDQDGYGNSTVVDSSMGRPGGYDDEDVFGHEEGHDVYTPSQNSSRIDHKANNTQYRSNTKPSAGPWYPSS